MTNKKRITTLAACSGNQQPPFSRYADFLETKVIKVQVCDLDTVPNRYPFRVAVRDSIAVVMDLHNMDHYLHAFIVIAAIAAAAGWNFIQSQNEMQLSELALANVEALAWEEEGWGPTVVKDCYTAFSGYDSNIYLTCSQYSSDTSVHYPCGATTSQKPAWGVTLVGKCYTYI